MAEGHVIEESIEMDLGRRIYELQSHLETIWKENSLSVRNDACRDVAVWIVNGEERSRKSRLWLQKRLARVYSRIELLENAPRAVTGSVYPGISAFRPVDFVDADVCALFLPASDWHFASEVG